MRSVNATSKETRRKPTSITNAVETEGKPALVCKGQEIGAVHLIDTLDQILRKSFLQPVSPDTRGTGKTLAEFGKDSRPKNSFMSLNFSGRSSVVASCKEKESSEGDESDGEPGEEHDNEYKHR